MTSCAAMSILLLSGACKTAQPRSAPAPAEAQAPSETERVLSAARAALRRSSYGRRDLELLVDTDLKRWSRWLSEYERRAHFEKSPAGKALKGKELVVVYAAPKSTYDPSAAFSVITMDGDAWVLMDKNDLACAFVIRG